MYKNNRILFLLTFSWTKIPASGIDISGFITTGTTYSLYTTVWGKIDNDDDKTNLLLEISLSQNKIFLYATYPNSEELTFIGSGVWYLKFQ